MNQSIDMTISNLRMQADNGDANAQYELGIKYNRGDGIGRDQAEAYYWLKKASYQNHPEAPYELGMLIWLDAQCLDRQKETRAFKLVKQSAELGYKQAQIQLSSFYEQGIGVKSDMALAKKWNEASDYESFSLGIGPVCDEYDGYRLDESDSQTINFEEEYSDVVNYYEKAKKMLELGEPELVLSSTRNSLEAMIKRFAFQCGEIFDTREVDLVTVIDILLENGWLTRDECSIMHEIRMHCNKGAHIDINGAKVSLDDAHIAVEKMGRLINVFKTSIINRAPRADNLYAPMENPDYYSQGRKHYGAWWNCYTREALLTIPEYVSLLNEAESGSISAMLDLAVGFLPSNIVWNDNMLINMPKYRYKGNEYYNPYSYDTRYYYWILRAVKTLLRIYTDDQDWYKKIPWRYITTAIYEALILSIELALENSYSLYIVGMNEYWDNNTRQKSLTPIYDNQYDLTSRLFHEDLFSVIPDIKETTRMFVDIVEKNIDRKVLAPIYELSGFRLIKIAKYIYYCSYAHQIYSVGNVDSPYAVKLLPFDEYLIIDDRDINKMCSLELLKQLTDDGICDYYYRCLTSNKYVREWIDGNRKKDTKKGMFSFLNKGR